MATTVAVLVSGGTGASGGGGAGVGAGAATGAATGGTKSAAATESIAAGTHWDASQTSHPGRCAPGGTRTENSSVQSSDSVGSYAAADWLIVIGTTPGGSSSG